MGMLRRKNDHIAITGRIRQRKMQRDAERCRRNIVALAVAGYGRLGRPTFTAEWR
jgi:hypothetical protein